MTLDISGPVQSDPVNSILSGVLQWSRIGLWRQLGLVPHCAPLLYTPTDFSIEKNTVIASQTENSLLNYVYSRNTRYKKCHQFFFRLEFFINIFIESFIKGLLS